jgi:hypothetical protein
MDGKLRTKRLFAQVPALLMTCDPGRRWRVASPSARVRFELRKRPTGLRAKILFFTVLDEFDFVAFGRVNEGNSTAVRRMWSVGQWITFCRGVFSEFVQIVDFKCEMREIGAHDNRAAPIEFAYLNFHVAAWCFQEDKL